VPNELHKRLRPIAALALSIAAGVWAYRAVRVVQSQNVYEVCRQCGLTGGEIAWLMDSAKNATGNRASLLAEFHKTFKPEQDPALCLPCAEAVLDEAGK